MKLRPSYFRNPIRWHLWLIGQRIKRAGQAWRLARGQLTKDDAQDLYHTVQRLSGWHCLESIDVEGVMERLKERFEDVPGLQGWAEEAASHVAHKWSSDGNIPNAAIDWAVDLVVEYAEGDGVKLVDLDDAEREGSEESDLEDEEA